MIERDGALRTWSLAAEPDGGAPEIPALQHFDHRLLYLDYEGEISGGRGWTKLWDRGTCEADWGETRIRLRLAGRRLRGEFELVFRNPGHRAEWVFRNMSGTSGPPAAS
jgi:hypothetical protein